MRDHVILLPLIFFDGLIAVALVLKMMINKNYIAFSLIIDIELYKGLKHINCHLIFHQYQYLFLISKIKHYKDKYSSNSFKNFYFHVIFSNKNSPL